MAENWKRSDTATEVFVIGDEQKVGLLCRYHDSGKTNRNGSLRNYATVIWCGTNHSSARCTPTEIPANKTVTPNNTHFIHSEHSSPKVMVDEDLGTIRVTRFTSVHDVGRIMNEKTARSQIIGGVIFGIGLR